MNIIIPYLYWREKVEASTAFIVKVDLPETENIWLNKNAYDMSGTSRYGLVLGINFKIILS